jgi:hypothetical protein
MLYVANPSTQRVIFPFREPVNNLINMIDLPSGQQTAVGRNWSPAQQAKVIEQIERYGGRDAAETHRKMGRFTGLIYRDMGQIEEDEIRLAHDAELETREVRSATAITAAALATDRALRARTNRRPSARETQTVVQQEVARGQSRTGAELAMDLTVTPEGRSDVKLPLG